MALQEIDIPKPLIDFITAHEIHCVAACCGEDAFDFTPEAIEENQWSEDVISKLDLEEAHIQLNRFRQAAIEAAEVPSNERLNMCWPDRVAVEEWCDLIEQLITHASVHLESKDAKGETNKLRRRGRRE